jgi:hypothetical protein
MICALCGRPLKGMTDSRVLRYNRLKAFACTDLEACEREQEDRDRVAKGLEPIRRAYNQLPPIAGTP